MTSRAVVFVLALALANCAGSHALVPTGATANSPPGTGSGVATPDNGAGALPGSQLQCSVWSTEGMANCTIAINIEKPPLSNPSTPVSMIPGFHPNDLHGAYGFPSTRPGGTVAIVDAYDDPAAEQELGVYRTAFGLAACTSANGCFRKVNQRGAAGAYPTADPNWSQEIALDLEMVSAVCPKCAILLVEADSASIDDLGAAVDRAASMGVTAVSNSYYALEWPGETSEDHHYHHPGVAVTVASGDRRAAYYPAASPYVTSIGGTSLVRGGSGAWSETAWRYTGAGCSAQEAKPAYQNHVSKYCKKRSTVDMAVDGDPQTGVAMFSLASGGWVVAGGTSVGAPMVAAAYALSGRPQGPAYSYAHAGAFRDIAPAGFDVSTGLGSPHGVGGL